VSHLSGYQLALHMLMLLGLIALPACATRPPAVRVQTQEVVMPIPVVCVDSTIIPKKPERLGLTPYPKNRAKREAMMAAHILRQQDYIERADPLLWACSNPFEEPSK
jgi:hypothetical protein